jgi:hypothetical protein
MSDLSLETPFGIGSHRIPATYGEDRERKSLHQSLPPSEKLGWVKDPKLIHRPCESTGFRDPRTGMVGCADCKTVTTEVETFFLRI